MWQILRRSHIPTVTKAFKCCILPSFSNSRASQKKFLCSYDHYVFHFHLLIIFSLFFYFLSCCKLLVLTFQFQKSFYFYFLIFSSSSRNGPYPPRSSTREEQRKLDKMTFRCPFQSQPFCDVMFGSNSGWWRPTFWYVEFNSHWRCQYHRLISVISIKYLGKKIPIREYNFSLQGTHRRSFWGEALCSVTSCSYGTYQQFLKRLETNSESFTTTIFNSCMFCTNTTIFSQDKHLALIYTSLGRDS